MFFDISPFLFFLPFRLKIPAVLPVRGCRLVESVASGPALHVSNGVGAGSARVALHLGLGRERRTEFALLQRLIAVMNLLGGQILSYCEWQRARE